MMLKTFGLYGISVLNAIRAFSATPFSRVLQLLEFFISAQEAEGRRDFSDASKCA